MPSISGSFEFDLTLIVLLPRTLRRLNNSSRRLFGVLSRVRSEPSHTIPRLSVSSNPRIDELEAFPSTDVPVLSDVKMRDLGFYYPHKMMEQHPSAAGPIYLRDLQRMPRVAGGPPRTLCRTRLDDHVIGKPMVEIVDGFTRGGSCGLCAGSLEV